MPIFKVEALKGVIEDIASSVKRASANSTSAVGCLRWVIVNEPKYVDPLACAELLATNIFRLREECFPEDSLLKLIRCPDPSAITLKEPERERIYWETYSYLFALLPLTVARPRIDKKRWSTEEYKQLVSRCFEHWYQSHPEENDGLLFRRYNIVEQAQKSWFGRRRKLNEALNPQLISDAFVSHIRLDIGIARQKAFAEAVEILIDGFLPAFRIDMQFYYFGAKALGFFADDPWLLPPHIGEKKESRHDK